MPVVNQSNTPSQPTINMSTYNGCCIFCGARQPGLHYALCVRPR